MRAEGSTLQRVAIPGDPDKGEVLVRIPPIAWLVAQGWLPAPLLSAAAEGLELDADERAVWVRLDEAEADALQAERFDAWIAAAMVTPRVVLQVDAAGGDTLHVDELSRGLKLAIWRATYQPFVETVRRTASTFEPFLLEPHLVAVLDLAARRYGQRPSTLIGISDPHVAIDFDLATAVRSRAAERPRPTTH